MRKIWALDGNFPIDAAKFQPNTSSNQTTAAPNMLTNSQLAVSSVPDGADIEVDDNFVGNTPSVVELVYVVRFPISSEWGIRRTMLELLTALVVLGVYFLFRISVLLKEQRNSLEEQLDREKAKEITRQNRKEGAERALKEAIRDLSDPKFKEMDYALGTGHGYRRAKRIVDAKSWSEIEAIVCGEDLATELDETHFWDATEEREREGKLFADPMPKWERVELGLEHGTKEIKKETAAGEMSERTKDSNPL